MNNQQADHNAVLRLCNNNLEALDWLQIGRRYVHEIDDLIDEDLPAGDRARGAERACRIGAMAIQLYTHPFFQKNWQVLSRVLTLCTVKYADSVRWEQSSVPWQRSFSDWSRHNWLDVVLVVADICGGYDVARNDSMELWAVCHADHHDQAGQAV